MILSKMSLKLSPAVYALSQLLLFMCLTMTSCMVVTHHQEERPEHSSNRIRCIERERRALLHFKQGLSDPCGILTSWGSVHDEDQHLHHDCCQWRGVGCSNVTDHVISLNLQAPACHDSFCCNGLRGNISSSLLVLEHLNYLDLSGIDFLNYSIPKFFGSLVRLTYLNLSDSNMSGEIPSQFKNLSNLQILDLSGFNSLYAKSLAWASRLSSLKTLDLSGVSLTYATDWVHIINSLPSLTQLNLEGCNLHNISPLSHLNSSKSLSYINLGSNFLSTVLVYPWLFNISSNLVKLVLFNNLLKGPIPEAVVNLNSLLYLDLSVNKLEGPIPKAVVNLNSLSYLDLSYNQLQGPIPEAVVNLNSLTYLDLSENQLQGPIPEAIGNLSSLSYLALSSNKLQGPILEGFGNMKSLSHLNLFSNQFTGGIPKSFRHLCSLRLLDLSGNNLTGDLFSLSDCVERSLETLSLGKNSLSGSLPDFSKFLSLRDLDLSYNQLNGSFPSLANSNSSLECLILENNQISGSLPEDLGQLSRLMILDLSSNFLNGTITKARLSNLTWKGSSHEYWKNLAFLQSIDLSSNQFSGEIPVEISSLVELQSLNLSRNYLSGPITWKLGQLKQLESLDLSRNLLSGEISISLLTLNSLNTLDLSYNNLSRKIPSGTQLQSFDESSYMGNPELCGPPLQKKCKYDATQSDYHSGEKAKDQDGESLSLGLYISIELGFITGFLGACGILVFKKSWRYAYFRLCNQLYDRIFVAVVVYVVRPIARFQA